MGLDEDLCTLGAVFLSSVLTDKWLKGQHFFHCNICASPAMCPVKVSLSETAGYQGWDGNERRREGDSRPRDERSGPKQTQISFALLRRQGAEHRVLVDATKPLKTTLQPGMPPPPCPIYPVTDTHHVHGHYPMETLQAEHSGSKAGHDLFTYKPLVV